MRALVVALAAGVIVLSGGAGAQQAAPVPSDLDVEKARSQAHQSEAQFYRMMTTKFGAEMQAAAAREAAVTRWWAEWWKGVYPAEPAPAAPKPPQ